MQEDIKTTEVRGASLKRHGGLGSLVLSTLASVWPSPVAGRDTRIGGEPGTFEYHAGYVAEQYMSRVWFGSPLGRAMPPLWGKDVLELGCGHGGVSCYLASLGTRGVVGIDINADNFCHGEHLAQRLSVDGTRALPVKFVSMDCHSLSFPDESFDAVFSDNGFEHYSDPGRVLREAYRVLRTGGHLVVPTFSSIRSKYGLHLKNGLKLPWANLFFSEQSIVAAMKRQAVSRPELFDLYPGLSCNPSRVRDLRKHKDLNDITHKEFLIMAEGAGFKVKSFKVHGTITGKIILKIIPSLERSALLDMLSTGAGAVLQKSEVSF